MALCVLVKGVRGGVVVDDKHHQCDEVKHESNMVVKVDW